jgi:thiol-disulfide isomerase/thioredoxin
MPDALSIGPFALPPVVLIALVALAAAYLALALYRRKLPEEEQRVRALVDRGSTAVLLAFLVWKLSPVFQWAPEIIADPVLLLRLPGGRGGTIAGALVGILWMAPPLLRDRALIRPIALAVAASVVGGLVAVGGLQTAAVGPSYDRAELFRTEVTLLGTGQDQDQVQEPLIDGSTPAVITFWATWCGPCYAELPVKKAAFAETAGTVRFLAVNMTNTESGIDAVQRYVTDNDISYPVAIDPRGRLASLFAVRGTPTTVVLSADGTIVARWMGPSDLGRITRSVDEALASSTGDQ